MVETHATGAVLQAAKTFGEALKNTSEMQAYREAADAVRADAELCALEDEVTAIYDALIARQQAGEPLAQHEVNQYYNLRDRLVRAPLVLEREARLKAVKALYQEAGGILSSALTTDYTALVLDE